MKLLASVLALAPLLGLAAPGDGTKQERFCVEQVQTRTAALVARDWSHLLAAADTHIRKCGRVFGAESLSEAHEHRVQALNGLKQPTKALQAADDCISVYYGNTGCHVLRALVLVNLKRYEASLASLDRADKLIVAGLESLARDLERPQHPLDRELAESTVEKLKAHQELADELRKTASELGR